MLTFLKNLMNPEQIDVASLLKDGAMVIDVRSPQEFAEGHATGSVNIPLGSLPNHIKEIQQQNKVVITCCRSGARAGSATTTLKQAGIETYNAGTWNAVQAAAKA